MQTNPRQLCALGFGAFLVPAVLLLPRVGWLWAGIASAGCALLLALLLLLQRGSAHAIAELAAKSVLGKGLLLLALLWNFLLLGGAARQLCAVYPTGNAFPLVGLLLLLLAVYAAEKGENVVLRVGAIIFFFLVVFFLLILGFSLPNIRVARLKPVTQVSPVRLAAVLPPLLTLYLRRGGEHCRVWHWLLGGTALALLCAVVTAGSLSPAVAATQEFPFYEAAKSVSVLGAMERLEPLVSAALTAGGFCMLSMLCAVNTRILSNFVPKADRLGALLNFSLGCLGLWLTGRLSGGFIALGTTIFCGLFPLGTLIVGFVKKT